MGLLSRLKKWLLAGNADAPDYSRSDDATIAAMKMRETIAEEERKKKESESKKEGE